MRCLVKTINVLESKSEKFIEPILWVRSIVLEFE